MNKFIKECKLCGSYFVGNAGSLYCSDECRDKVRQKSQFDYWTRHIKEEKLVKRCPVCNKEFVAKTGQMYCSIKCRNKKWGDVKKTSKEKYANKYDSQQSAEKYVYWMRDKGNWKVEKKYNGKVYQIYGFQIVEEAVKIRDELIFRLENNTCDEWYKQFKKKNK